MTKKKVILALIVLGVVLLIGVSPICNVKSVVVEDIGSPNANFDRAVLDVKSNFFLYDTKNLSNAIMESGLVSSVNIEKKWFLSLKVSIEWRRPIIYLKSSDLYAAVDREGYVLDFVDRLSGEGFIDGLIIKYAKIGEAIITENDYITKNAVILHHLFLENPFIIGGITLSPRISVDGTDIIQHISDDYIINFGDGDEPEERFKKAIAIYEELSKKGVKNGIINLRRKNHFVYETWK